MDGRTFLSLISTTITLLLFVYALYCAIVSHIAERAAQRGARVGPDPQASLCNRRVAARLAFGAAALLGVLAFTATAASWPPLRAYLGALRTGHAAGSFDGGVRLLAGHPVPESTIASAPAAPEAPSTALAPRAVPEARSTTALPRALAVPPSSTVSPAPPARDRRREARPPTERKSALSAASVVPPASAPEAPRVKPTRTSRSLVVDLPANRESNDRPDPRARLERGERPKAVERTERVNRVERPERVNRVTTIERSERPERAERLVRVERTERIDRIERPERRERLERLERPERPLRIQLPERLGARR